MHADAPTFDPVDASSDNLRYLTVDLDGRSSMKSTGCTDAVVSLCYQPDVTASAQEVKHEQEVKGSSSSIENQEAPQRLRSSPGYQDPLLSLCNCRVLLFALQH